MKLKLNLYYDEYYRFGLDLFEEIAQLQSYTQN